MYDSYKKWLEDGRPKIFCQCGCGEEIIVKEYHKYRGIVKYIGGHNNRRYPISETYQKWLDDGCPKIYCQCGCNQEIVVFKRYKSCGIPKFIQNHYSYKNKKIVVISDSYKKWLNNSRPKVFCQCGCGQEIIISERYKYRGITKYIHGHNPPSNKNPYPPIFDLCQCGCNEKPWKLIPLCKKCHNKVHNNKVIING